MKHAVFAQVTIAAYADQFRKKQACMSGEGRSDKHIMPYLPPPTFVIILPT